MKLKVWIWRLLCQGFKKLEKLEIILAQGRDFGFAHHCAFAHHGEYGGEKL